MLARLQDDGLQQLSSRAVTAKAACDTLPSLRERPDCSLASFVLSPIRPPSSCWGPSAGPLPAHFVRQKIDSRDLTHYYHSLPTFSGGAC